MQPCTRLRLPKSILSTKAIQLSAGKLIQTLLRVGRQSKVLRKLQFLRMLSSLRVTKNNTMKSKQTLLKWRLFLALILAFGINQARGQVASDIELINSMQIEKAHQHVHDVKFGFDTNKHFIVKYNPISLSFSSLMFVYQKWLSPQISSNCYYEPSCSVYSKMLIQEYGPIKGLLSSADRLMRCDRISATTFHPVSIDPVDSKIHESVHRYRISSYPAYKNSIK